MFARRQPARWALLLTLLLALIPALTAQSPAFEARTGDPWLDEAVQEAEDLSTLDPPGFLQSLAKQYAVPVADLQALRDQGLRSGELILALNLSRTTKKPLKDVTASWKVNKGKGWGTIAQSLGVKPGSDAFQTFKNSALNEKERLKAEDAKNAGGAMMKAAEPKKDASGMKAKKP